MPVRVCNREGLLLKPARNRVSTLLLLLVLYVSLGVPAEAGNRVLVCRCNDGYRFVVSVESGKAWLFLPQQTVALKEDSHQRGLFSGEGVRFSFNGTHCLLERGERTLECRNRPEEAVWERAKLEGVDFRAVGNEPGWVLEIRIGDEVSLLTDYGTKRLRFDYASPLVEGNRTIYRLSNERDRLTVVLEGRPCKDPRGERYETTVELLLDGERLKGCGMALH